MPAAQTAAPSSPGRTLDASPAPVARWCGAPGTPAELTALLEAAHPFLRITGVERRDWCRPMQNPRDGRFGPWRYFAHHEVLDEACWRRAGEVIYFVWDARGQLRLVGQSSARLAWRWKHVPMHCVTTRAPLGERALFHTSAWPAMEAAFNARESGPFTVAALFGSELEALCAAAGGALHAASQAPRSKLRSLAWHVESWVCGLKAAAGLPLWNVAKT